MENEREIRKEIIEERISKILSDLEGAITDKVKFEMNFPTSKNVLSEKHRPSKSRRFKSPDAIEFVLREKGYAMHARDITNAVRQLDGFAELNQQEITSTLVRHNAKKKRFVRVSTNTYDLIERVGRKE